MATVQELQTADMVVSNDGQPLTFLGLTSDGKKAACWNYACADGEVRMHEYPLEELTVCNLPDIEDEDD